VSYESFNPLCGDRIRIELKLTQTTVAEARFKGDACAISTAAASLLTELITGTQLEAVAALSDDQLVAALESNIQPARLQCALLPLEALRAGLKERLRDS
jgi:nitrogen fixation NifU-like protein